MEVVDYKEVIFDSLLMLAGMVFPGGVGVFRLVFGLVSCSCTYYLPLGLVFAVNSNPFCVILDGLLALGLVQGGHPYETCCDEDYGQNG